MHNNNQILEQFLAEWPIERIENLTLEEYTNTDKTSFCYWLEAKTQDLGSIWGGTAHKFGIYKRVNTTKVDTRSGYESDSEYAWVLKYGKSRDEAFNKIKTILIDVIRDAMTGDLNKIDSIDLGPAVKWKIAFIYSQGAFLPFFNINFLKKACTIVGIEASNDYYQMQTNLMDSKPEGMDVYSWANELLETIKKGNPTSKQEDIQSEMPAGESVLIQLINTYKEHIRQDGLDDELYKWRLINKYHGKPDISADNFHEEVASIDYSNLIYMNTKKVLKDMSQFYPKETRECFRDLFDHQTPLQDRITSFLKETELIFYKYAPKPSLKPSQEERSIATYLAFYDPDRYPLYKSSFYNKYCALLGIPPAKPKEKYVHYIGLLNKLIENYIATDQELLELVSQLKTEDCYDDPEHLILAQDILYQMLDQEKFKKANDVSKPPADYKKKDEVKYWLYAPGAGAMYWDEFYAKGVMAIGWDELGDLTDYNDKSELVKALQEHSAKDTPGSMKNDSTACFEFAQVMKEGDIVIAKNGVKQLVGMGVIRSAYQFDDNREYFKHIRLVDWQKKGNWDTEFSLATKTLTDITSYKTEHPQYEYYYQRLLAMMEEGYIPHTKLKTNGEAIEIPLNLILYGPPGTGKTHYLKNVYFNHFTSKKSTVSRDEFLKSFVMDRMWWEIIALVLLDLGKSKVADILNHELLQLKASLSNSTAVTATIWGQLQSHTIDSCKTVNVAKKASPLIFNKTEEKHWEVVTDELAQQAPEVLKYQDQIKNFKEATDEIRRYEFVTFHQSFSYEDFIEGIRPSMNEGDSDLSYQIEDGIFKKMCLKASKDPNQDYAVFIDEINRGNVSQIFGELITLLEEDKREGATNEIEVTLPYSKNRFTVPPNLYVIGTMNTADRSVEALDTALRRRFTFKEIQPNPEILRLHSPLNTFSENLLVLPDALETMVEIMTTINRRIEKLLDRDHTIGHSYFLTVKTLEDLKLMFANKIIPLLQEYFYGDMAKIGLVIGKGFVTEEIIENVFADFDHDALEDLEERKVLRLITSWDSDEQFIGAITTLLNRK